MESQIDESATNVSGIGLAGVVEVHGVVAEPAALPELVELDALDLDGREPLPDDDVAPEEALAGPRVAIPALGRRLRGKRLVQLRTRRHDPDAAAEQRHGGPRLRPLFDVVAQFEAVDGIARNRIPLAVVVVLDLLLDLDRRPVLGVLRDRQQLGVARQVVRRGDDDLIAFFQSTGGIDDQRGRGAGVARAHRPVQPHPALPGRPGFAAVRVHAPFSPWSWSVPPWETPSTL